MLCNAFDVTKTKEDFCKSTNEKLIVFFFIL